MAEKMLTVQQVVEAGHKDASHGVCSLCGGCVFVISEVEDNAYVCKDCYEKAVDEEGYDEDFEKSEVKNHLITDMVRVSIILFFIGSIILVIDMSVTKTAVATLCGLALIVFGMLHCLFSVFIYPLLIKGISEHDERYEKALREMGYFDKMLEEDKYRIEK